VKSFSSNRIGILRIVPGHSAMAWPGRRRAEAVDGEE